MSEYEKPVISTYPATNITNTSAEVHGEVHSVGDATDGILDQVSILLYHYPNYLAKDSSYITTYHFLNVGTGHYSYVFTDLMPGEVYKVIFMAIYFKDPAYEYDPTYGSYYMSICGAQEEAFFITIETVETVISEKPLIHNTRLWTQESPTEGRGGWIFVQAHKIGQGTARLNTMAEKSKDITYVSASAINRVTVSQNHTYDPPAPTILFHTIESSSRNIYFNNNVLLEGSLIVEEEEGEERTKSCVINTKNYGKRLMYALETPSTYFCDIINTNLKNGENWIDIESMFAETISSYIVFPSSLSKGYITIEQKLKDKFKAILYDAEKTSVYFLIYGKQKNHETEYMKEIKEVT